MPVQTQQDLGEMLRQAAGGAASDRLRQQMGDRGGSLCGVTVYECRDRLMSESPAGRSPSGASHQPAAPQPAEARPSTEATAPPAGMNVEQGWENLRAALISTHKEETGGFHRGRLWKLQGNHTWKKDSRIHFDLFV